MPNGNTEIIKAELTVPARADRLWACVSDWRGVRSLFEGDAAAKLEPDGAGGMRGRLRLGATLFKVRMRPYDALATAEGCRLALRLTPASNGSTIVVAAASCARGCGFSTSEERVSAFLQRLAQSACEGAGKTVYKSDNQESAPREKRAQTPTRSEHEGKSKASKPSGGRAWLAALGIIAAAAAAFAIWSFWPFGGASAHAGSHAEATAADLSSAVNAENVSALTLGMSRAQVETLFASEGLKTASGEYIYRCDELNGQSQPIRQIKAVYEGDALASYTYLDLSAAQQIGAIAPASADLSASAVSMLRAYAINGEEYSERHYGYVDPFANFSPSWRGEAAVVTNAASGDERTEYLKGYDGADPLMLGSLEGEAASSQYDDYDVFLADKLAFDEALLMANGYSRGDAAAVFGEGESYDAGSGVMLTRILKGAADESGARPYSYSFRFDSTGAFELGSFSNTRLYGKAGAFAGCKPAEVGPGQSYGEVRYLMPIVPTALFVNDNFYTVCYGRYTGGSEIKYQFELVVSFNLASGVVEAVYDNIIPDSAAS